jgi:hypothetical protein
MNAFDKARKVEAVAMDDLIPFLRDISFEGRFVLTDKGNLSKTLQKTVGDAMFNCKLEQKIWAVEIKSEQNARYGNLFLELWSNKSRYTPGWMLTLQADVLFYYFVDERRLYILSMNKLKKWAFDNWRITRFPERKQNKYVQMNDTWGACVPIHVLEEEIGMRRYSLSGDVATDETAELQLFGS